MVDSSVWIDYFKNGNYTELDFLIEEELACINELIFTEIAPLLMKKNEENLLESLKAVEMIPMNIDWEIIRRYRLMNLKNGINKVGIPDLIILQQVINEKISLFTVDKQFTLMQNHLHFNLFQFKL